MSHTLHRRGNPENLSGDYILFSMSAKGHNSENSRHALKEFLEIADKYGWVNMGDMKTGGYYLVGKEAIMQNVQDTSIVHAVFSSKEEMAKAVKEIKEAGLGVSVIISYSGTSGKLWAKTTLPRIRWRYLWVYAVKLSACLRTTCLK